MLLHLSTVLACLGLSHVARRDIPNEHKAQSPSLLSIEELHSVTEQDIHVRVHALQDALVLGLSPFQADNDLGTDPESQVSHQ